MSSSAKRILLAIGIVVVGVAVGLSGIYLGHIDDAPPLGLLGILIMIGSVVLGIRTAIRRT